MNIVQSCSHYQFPAKGSAGAERIVERLCRGFVKLGHKVYLHGAKGSTTDTGAIVVDSIPDDADIIHLHGVQMEKQDQYNKLPKPWVGTIHGGGMETDPKFLTAVRNHPNIICVSKFVADRLHCSAFVHSCASPEEFEYSDTKDNYLLYLAGFGWGMQKGLDVFFQMANLFPGIQFYVAGSGGDPEFVKQVQFKCSQSANLRFLGEINGKDKASYLSKAKALMIPTHLPDACPSTVSEALISGTPVIASTNGSMPEIIPANVGYTCKGSSQYMKAIMNISGKLIKPSECRDYAEKNYSDVAAAKKHLIYYQSMLEHKRVVI
jgi:glycosyltransferase involved in cell wall biosynthesis